MEQISISIEKKILLESPPS